MYFANMFCYGSDNDCVGITGIRGCMGVVFKGTRALYAIHIPPMSPETDAYAGRVFARYILNNQEPRPGAGELLVFVNGANRPAVVDEANAIKSMLQNPPTTVFRIMTHLGPNSGGGNADSVSIMVRHVHGGLEKLYKHVPDNAWITGGKSEYKMYKENSGFRGNKVPNDLVSGWFPVDENNCTCQEL